MKLFKKIILMILSIIIIPVFLLSIFVIYQKYVLKIDPTFMGYSFYINTGTSMEPDIMPGDAIIIKKYDSYKVNDVITFDSDEGYITTHRIIKIDNNLYTTKGDSNNFIDGVSIRNDKIHGKVIKIIKNYNDILKKIYNNFVYIILGLLLIFILIINFKKKGNYES